MMNAKGVRSTGTKEKRVLRVRRPYIRDRVGKII